MSAIAARQKKGGIKKATERQRTLQILQAAESQNTQAARY